MKALKTPLARQVLADERAREQLRQFLADRSRGDATIELRSEGRTRRLRPVLVPKAA